jgi:8-oxo-dGTP pyrophosphatase MutT (NUDIX family)
MTFEKLVTCFQKELPGEFAHREFLPLRGSSQEAIANGATYRNSAVAIVLFLNAQQQLSTVVIQRPIYNGSHSGQISFPGGKQEHFDFNLQATAIRECMEEIGLQLNSDQFIGTLSQVYIPVSQFLISPFVFYLENFPKTYQPDLREVAQIHEIDLFKLFQPESILHLDIPIQQNTVLKDVPHFTQSGIKIWGATALILNELKHLLANHI